MTDRYLIDRLTPQYPWMPRVYEATSGFIHLSERHVHLALRMEGENRFKMQASDTDQELPIELWAELVEGFQACTSALFDFLHGWAYTKANPELVKELRDGL